VGSRFSAEGCGGSGNGWSGVGVGISPEDGKLQTTERMDNAEGCYFRGTWSGEVPLGRICYAAEAFWSERKTLCTMSMHVRRRQTR
jgi:hypothetical protein